MIERFSMHDTATTRQPAARSLGRLLPRVQAAWNEAGGSQEDWQAFETRLRREWQRLFDLLLALYGQHYDFFYHLEQLLLATALSWHERARWLKQSDAEHEANPDWFQSQQMMGGMLYVDLFSGTLAGLHDYLPYFKELGLTYVHLMPLFDAPAGDSDG